jgi:hypothetical protein
VVQIHSPRPIYPPQIQQLHAAFLETNLLRFGCESCETLEGRTKPRPISSHHSRRYFRSSRSCSAYPGEECSSGLDCGSFALRPVALLALLSEQTRLASSRRGRLHPGFQRLGHPRRRRIYLQCQLGNMHWRDSRPLDHQLASLHYPGALIRDAARPSDQLAWRGARGCGTRAERQQPEAARQRQT